MPRIAEYHLIEQVVVDGEPTWFALVPGRQDGFPIAEHLALAELEARGPDYRHWTWDLPPDALPCFRGASPRGTPADPALAFDATLVLRSAS